MRKRSHIAEAVCALQRTLQLRCESTLNQISEFLIAPVVSLWDSPLQALQLIQGEVKDVGHVMVGVPAAVQLVLHTHTHTHTQ